MIAHSGVTRTHPIFRRLSLPGDGLGEIAVAGRPSWMAGRERRAGSRGPTSGAPSAIRSTRHRL